MAQVANEELGRDEVLVERKVVAAKPRTSPVAVIILVAFAVTCAVVFFGGYIRMPAENVAPSAAPTTTTNP